MAKWKEYKEDFILFAEAGFIAVNQADEDAALKLFRSAELLDPDNSLAKIGFGYLHLHKLDLKQACKMFEEVLERDPHNEMAKALLGLSLSLGPATLAKGEQVLEQAVHAKDPMVKDLSHMALDFVEKFLKKAPTPVQGEMKKK